MIERGANPPQPKKHISSKMGVLKIRNMDHIYGNTKAQLPRKKMGYNPP
jgi:hypothetical protein